jgi:uncharacterized membrane protein YbaN (DUF454 family)
MEAGRWWPDADIRKTLVAYRASARIADLADVHYDLNTTMNTATRDLRVMVPPRVTGMRRWVLLICGTVSLGLGLVGIFVPLLPTTCFLLLAAWCYARSSPRLYDRLLNARLIGPYLRRYRESRVIPPKVKIAALVMMWITIGYAVITYPNLAVRLTLLAIAIGVTAHLLTLPGLQQRARGSRGGPRTVENRSARPESRMRT